MGELSFILLYDKYQGFLYFFLGIVSSYVFFLLSLKGARVVYDSINDMIINKETQIMPADIDILYNNKMISKLARTNIYIWNSGYKAVRKDDLVNKDNIRIVFNKEAQIYSAKIIKNNDESNGFSVNLTDSNIIELDFDYMERKSGVKIEVLHNDQSSSFIVKGKIIGMRQGIRRSKNLINGKINSLRDICTILAMYIVAAITGFMIVALTMLIYSKLGNSNIIMTIGIFLSWIIPAILSPLFLKSYTRSKNHPDYLD